MNRQHVSDSDTQAKSHVWLTTFNDMMTLLMVFFVLLFSMGTLDVNRFENFQNALQSAMGILEAGRNASGGLISDRQMYTTDRTGNGSTSDQSVEDMSRLSGTQGLEAQYTPKGIQLTLDDGLLFNTGSATITEDGVALLDRVAAIVRPMHRTISVQGHTDNVPIVTQRFPSNWELSTARAIRVVKFFIEQGGIDPSLLSAVGYGDSKPLMPNDSAVNRSMNRRVEIILGPVQSHEPEI